MVHVPAGYSSWAKQKPLGIYLVTLGIATVHKSRCPRVLHHNYKGLWILNRGVATLDTHSVWRVNPNKQG